MTYDVYGVGNSLVDIQARVSDDVLGQSNRCRSRRCARSGWSRTAGGRRSRCAAATSSWSSPTAATSSSSASPRSDGRWFLQTSMSPTPTSSCTATPPTPSSTAPRRRRSWRGAAGARLRGPRADRPRRRLGVDGVRAGLRAGFGRLRPIVGAELTVAAGEPVRRSPRVFHLTLLVESRDGCRNLCRLLTEAHRGTRPAPGREPLPPALPLELARGARRGARLPLRLRARRRARGRLRGRREAARADAAAAEALGRRLVGAFGRERFRVELQRPFWRRDRARNRWLAELAERLGVPCVATGNVHCTTRSRAPLQDALRRGPARRRRWRSRSPSGAATGSAHLARRRRWRRASPSIPEAVAESRAARRAARASTSPATSATATRAPRTPTPTARWPRSAGRGSTSATPASRDRREARAAARGGAATDPQRSASPASSSSTTTCSSWPARSRPRCAGRTRRARSCRPGRGRGLERQLDRLLPDRPLPRRPGARRALPRPLPQRGDRRGARHRPRLPARHPRGADPPRARALRRATARPWSPPSPPTARAGRCATSARRSGCRRGRSSGWRGPWTASTARRGRARRSAAAIGAERAASRALAGAGPRWPARRGGCPATPPSTRAGW